MKHYFVLVAATLFLTGCMTTKPMPAEMTKPTVNVAEIQDWTLRGKIGIRFKEKGANANLDWRQQNNDYTVRLSGPLGQGGFQIIGNDHKITLIDQNGKRVELDSPEAFFKKQFGWELPVQCLTHWIKGIPASNDHIQATYFENGKLKTLNQHGWAIEYQEYMMTSSGLLPQRLILSQPGTQLKIIVKEWEL